MIRSTLAIVALLADAAHAEDKSDLGPTQNLIPSSSTPIYVDIVDDTTETIRYAGRIPDPNHPGSFLSVTLTLRDPLGNLVGNFNPGIIPVSAGPGAYEITLQDRDLDGDGLTDSMETWEFTVLDGASQPILGRVWAKRWRIDAGGFGAGNATDGSFFAVVDGGAPGKEGVVELKAGGLAGNRYSLIANAGGIEGGNGRSRLNTEEWHADGQHRVYLAPPDPAVTTYDVLTPVLTNPSLTPESTCPAVAPGVEGAGAVVAFDSSVAGVAHLVCDLDHDGDYDMTSDEDFHLLVEATSGANSFVWNGEDNTGALVPEGTYLCVLRLTVGEFHYVADDMETSYPGFRLYQVNRTAQRTPLAMYWNDAEVMFQDTQMPNNQFGLETSGPTGLDSGSYALPAVANTNARAWGSFTSLSRGDNALLDTYTWLDEDEVGPFPVIVREVVADRDGDGLVDAEEECVTQTSPIKRDTDSDGVGDFDEVRGGVSDPIDEDSDDDGLLDGVETDDPYDPADEDLDGYPDVVDDDDDGDGVLTVLEGTTDVDGDGRPNHLDTDDDGDHVPTAAEDTNGDGVWNDDNDGDGQFDFLDRDDDDDGVPFEDPGGDGDPTNDDTDQDGVTDYLDDDDDGDGVLTSHEVDRNGDHAADDFDHDGDPNHLDTDDDDDGLDTSLEGEGDVDGDGDPNFLDPDADGDGVDDTAEGAGDTDTDGDPDFLDTDDDGDGVDSGVELGDTASDPSCAGGSTPAHDLDDDGVPDRLDGDDDGDGVPTAEEWDRDGNGIADDQDGDGVPNYRDCDDDGDGVPSTDEGSGDTDTDGDPDFLDTDADGDTIGDGDEGGRDSDGDGADDFQDADDDGDGVPTFDELGDAAGAPGTDGADWAHAPDQDGDTNPDWLDEDDDGDGIPTLTEGGFGDDADGDGAPNHLDLDSDGDTVSDQIEGAEDTDDDGTGDFVDTDADGDRFEDAVEGTADTDGDGTADFQDTDDDEDGVRSRDERDGDTDGDGTPDRIDTDDDGDTLPTATESADGLQFGSDVDGDGDPNWVDTEADGDGVLDAEEGSEDQDGDGLPNYLDPDGAYIGWYRGTGLSSTCDTGGGTAPLGVVAWTLGLIGLRRRRR